MFKKSITVWNKTVAQTSIRHQTFVCRRSKLKIINHLTLQCYIYIESEILTASLSKPQKTYAASGFVVFAIFFEMNSYRKLDGHDM
jgi:hypothetical protein